MPRATETTLLGSTPLHAPHLPPRVHFCPGGVLVVVPTTTTTLHCRARHTTVAPCVHHLQSHEVVDRRPWMPLGLHVLASMPRLFRHDSSSSSLGLNTSFLLLSLLHAPRLQHRQCTRRAGLSPAEGSDSLWYGLWYGTSTQTCSLLAASHPHTQNIKTARRMSKLHRPYAPPAYAPPIAARHRHATRRSIG